MHTFVWGACKRGQASKESVHYDHSLRLGNEVKQRFIVLHALERNISRYQTSKVPMTAALLPNSYSVMWVVGVKDMTWMKDEVLVN